MTTKDPVVQDLKEWINRSAGQHQRRVSEGTESSRRLMNLPVYDTMTDDPYLLHRTHRVGTHDLEEDDGFSVGGCCTNESPQRIEYAGEEPYSAASLALAAFVVGALCLLVWHLSPELRGLVSIIKN